MSLPILSGFVLAGSWIMLKLPTAVGVPGFCATSVLTSGVRICAPVLIITPTRLGILGTVARVAGHVDQVRAERVVQDRRSAIVARIGVGFCNAKLPVLIYLRHRTVVVVSRSNGRIDFSGRVGIRNVNCANRRQIAHEGQVVAIGRQIERQF